MEKQGYKNHMRKAPRAYYLGLLLALMTLIFSLIYCKDISTGWRGNLLPALFAYLCIAIILIGYFARSFALKAQDRAIRAEENVRHFVLSGKLLDSKLTISQIIALRFASDEEFLTLAQRAVAENMSSKQIKEAIQHWRADYYRV